MLEGKLKISTPSRCAGAAEESNSYAAVGTMHISCLLHLMQLQQAGPYRVS
jgi:hypothetical protein